MGILFIPCVALSIFGWAICRRFCLPSRPSWAKRQRSSGYARLRPPGPDGPALLTTDLGNAPLSMASLYVFF